MLFFPFKNMLMFFMLISVIGLTSRAQEGLDQERVDINKFFIRTIGSGDVQTVQALLDQAVDVDTQNRFGDSALMVAIYYNHEQIVQILLDAGADFDFQNPDGMTPLMVASTDVVPGRDTIVTELLQKGADSSARNNDGDTALDIAIKSHQRNVSSFATMDPEQLHPMDDARLTKLKAPLDVVFLLVADKNDKMGRIQYIVRTH